MRVFKFELGQMGQYGPHKKIITETKACNLFTSELITIMKSKALYKGPQTYVTGGGHKTKILKVSID